DLSPDGRSALARTDETGTSRLVLLATGAGDTREIPLGGLEPFGGGFFPDGQHIYVNASERDEGVRVYVQTITGEGRRALTPPGFGANASAVSPDGSLLVVTDLQGRLFLTSVDGGPMRPIPLRPAPGRLAPVGAPIHWAAEGRFIYVANASRELPSGILKPTPMRIARVDTRTGRVDPWREIAIPDPAGITGAVSFLMTPDRKAYAYSYGRILCSLYLVDGLR